MDELIAQIAALMSQVEVLTAENQRLREELAKRKPAAKEPEPLKEFDSVEDIEWERGPHNANTFALQQFFGKGVDTRPWKQVIVKGIGRVYRMGNQVGTPDWYGIAHNRCLDVTKSVWVCKAQEGDDAFESDYEDMARLVREYEGGLRWNLAEWDSHELGGKLKEEFLKTHDNPDPVTDRKPVPVTRPA